MSKLKYRKKWHAAYQLAGGLLLAPDHFTEGQRDRLTELLLNVLSEPDRYTAGLIRILQDSAQKP